MTRFMRELSGELGSYWKSAAEKKIEEMKERIERDEIRTSINGGAFWNSNGHYLPLECAEVLSFTDFPFSLEETNRAREEQEKLFLERYKATHKEATLEERHQMRAAFGTGQTIVNIFTGERIRL